MGAFTSCCLIREEQRGANTPLCGRAHWPTNPATNIDFTTVETERKTERKSNSLGKKKCSRFSAEHLEIPSGGRER